MLSLLISQVPPPLAVKLYFIGVLAFLKTARQRPGFLVGGLCCVLCRGPSRSTHKHEHLRGKKSACLREVRSPETARKSDRVSYSCLLIVLKNTKRPDIWMLIRAVFHCESPTSARPISIVPPSSMCPKSPKPNSTRFMSRPDSFVSRFCCRSIRIVPPSYAPPVPRRSGDCSSSWGGI
jgi:hypothetical protein